MVINGVEIPDSYRITYNGNGLYNERYKLLQARLGRTSGTLMMLRNDLEAKKTTQKMLSSNEDNNSIYRDQVYVREILFNGSGERYVYIPIIDNQVSGDLDASYLVADKVCYIISSTGFLESKIVSIINTKMATDITYDSNNNVIEIYKDCWKIELYSRVPVEFNINDDLRFVVEK